MRLADYFDAAASRFPSRTAFVDGAVRIDFADAQRFVHAVAHALAAEPSLAAGAHVAIYAPNDYRVSLLQIAINRADMAWVAVHTRNSVETNIQVLEYADVQLVFFHSAYERLVPQLRSGLAPTCRFISIDAPSADGRYLADWTASHGTPFCAGPEEPDRTVLLQPTGGTTGPSKAAVHTNRSVEMGIVSTFVNLGMDSETRVLAVAPLTHAASYLTFASAARGGMTVVLPAFDVEAVLAAIERDRITHLFVPPTVIYTLIGDSRTASADLSSLRAVLVGGAPIAPEKMREAIRRLGPVIYEVFAQSECLCCLIKKPADYLRPDGSLDEGVLRSAGQPGPFGWVEIMDESGNLAGPGVKGEIVVKSTSVMKGYYKNPGQTAEVSAFGWHHTTDVGVRDERGFITVLDRTRDMIVSGGFNLFPSEIEAVINSHPAVLDCAVVGVPDEKWGEAAKAVVQLKAGKTLSADEVIVMCKTALGSLKTPKSVEFWPDLPRSAVGKVLKRDIRARFWEGQWRAV
ncbi:long-chain fatty acid--CoA ligase [Caballeronia hypogeia]|uniref:Long-chain fatty acid--CoA ligase n=1 Tax=Caballeronia hypogeia TaxID=1777140 RepID=A0A158CV64_9BURK|nr:AMP-binding protein [Caballeronia hypogeia]SAK86218.1 long-chain fatty acid--CoA ligase [Caballeronia hypogeia]